MSESVALIVTIDGGAASGKSTQARLLADRFSLLHVDTGSHYRALTWALRAHGVDTANARAVEAALPRLEPGAVIEGQTAHVTVGGQRPTTAQLKSAEVNAHVSTVAAQPAVRAFLRDFQRGFARRAAEACLAGLVMEGRDIGSVIFPDAPLRCFLEADARTRAERRAAEGLTDAVAARDKADSTRQAAPLTCPEGAIRVDNSTATVEETFAELAAQVEAWQQHRAETV